jgi:iron complex transport system substrate-binding protein
VGGAAVHAVQAAAVPPPLAESARLAPLPITDDRGKTVQLAKPPQRIVSLLPSLTESTCALGLCDRLVGVDRYQLAGLGAEAARSGRRAGPQRRAQARSGAAVQRLKVAERLESLGIKVAALEVKSQAGVHQVLDKLGRLLGVPQAQGADRVWRELQTGVADIARQMPDSAKQVRVYFEVSRGPYAAGPQSFIGETLTQLGVRNVVPADLGPFPRLNPEFLLRAQPDVIMLGNRSMQVATSYPGWNSLGRARQPGVHIQRTGIQCHRAPRPAHGRGRAADCALPDRQGAQSAGLGVSR